MYVCKLQVRVNSVELVQAACNPTVTFLLAQVAMTEEMVAGWSVRERKREREGSGRRARGYYLKAEAASGASKEASGDWIHLMVRHTFGVRRGRRKKSEGVSVYSAMERERSQKLSSPWTEIGPCVSPSLSLSLSLLTCSSPLGVSQHPSPCSPLQWRCTTLWRQRHRWRCQRKMYPGSRCLRRDLFTNHSNALKWSPPGGHPAGTRTPFSLQLYLWLLVVVSTCPLLRQQEFIWKQTHSLPSDCQHSV